jgi:hypothetical protein
VAYPTATEIRDRVPALKSVDAFPDVVLTDLIESFAGMAERYRGTAYVTRTVTGESHELYGDTVVWLEWPNVQSVTSITVTLYGSTQTIDVTSCQVDKVAGRVDLGSIFASPVAAHGAYAGTALFNYTHGLTTTPPGLVRACREFVRASALRDASNVGRDVVSQAGEAGGTTRYVTEDWDRGRPTSFAGVNQELNALRDYRTRDL